jgi:23S rRNA pseudouridine955/2504/2580 synthase/23S rRNA pseudouridine1911/1915/1917 synthase
VSGPRRRGDPPLEETVTIFEIGRSPAAGRERPERRPRAPRIGILREEPGWTAVLKPAGVASVKERWKPEAPTVLELLHAEWRRRDPAAPKPFVVHRIDKETSGLMLFGRDAATAKALSAAFRRRLVRKEYLALVIGRPPEPSGTLELRLLADPRRPERMRVDEKRGKRSVTAWETAEEFRGWTLLRAIPLTGRTHQIRVTLARLGCPVVADHLYGDGARLFLSSLKRGFKPPRDHGEFPLLGRLGLHAHRLRFPDPADPASEASVEAPIPKDFRVTLEKLRRFASSRD